MLAFPFGDTHDTEQRSVSILLILKIHGKVDIAAGGL